MCACVHVFAHRVYPRHRDTLTQGQATALGRHGQGKEWGDLGGWGASPGRKALVTFLTPSALGQSWGLLGACGGMIPEPGFVYTWTWP